MKTLTTLLLATAALSAGAQTIQHGQLGPWGVSTTMHQPATALDLSNLGTGAGQTWDFASLNLAEVGTMHFHPTGSKPFEDQFPQANWAWIHEVPGQSAYYYLEIDEQGIQLWDRNLGLSNPVIYTDPVKVMKFPFALGESFTDTYATASSNSSKHWTYAGHGTLVLPMATVPDVALVISQEGDVVFWHTAPLYPMMIADDGNAMFYLQNNVGVAEQGGTALHAWPNPCRGQLVVEGATPGAFWRITDAQGRKVFEGRAREGRLVLGTGPLAPGVYTIHLGGGQAAGTVLRFVKE